MATGGFKYRPDIDGLRTIAVLSVFAFHFKNGLLPGGFVGVDIFFIISGYLISSILIEDSKDGKIDLNKFYQRRISRIFPAFFTVALTTLIAAYFIYTAQDFSSAGAALSAAAVSLVNIKFAFQGNYFDVSPDAQPFIHYWSLSVEEQFYIILSISLLILYKFFRKQAFWIMGCAAVLSFASCVILTKINPVWAFYFLPTRAWELLAGGLIACAAADGRSVTAPRWAGAAGLILIAVSFFVIREGAQFPGWIAALPVLGAVAVIMPGSGAPDLARRFLSARPMVAIGKMSYSLYLWHWPVFCLVDYQLYMQSDLARGGLKIGLCVLLTLASYYLIESPARKFLNRPANRTIAYGFFAAMLVLCVPLGLKIRGENYVNARLSAVAEGGRAFPGRPGGASVFLIGDSNGSMYGKLVKDICKDVGCRLNVLSVDAADPLPDLAGAHGRLWLDSMEAIRKARPDYVVFASSWAEKLQGDPGRLALALRELQPHVGHIILINQPPQLPESASRAAIRAGARPPFREAAKVQGDRRDANASLLGFRSPEVSVLDISSRLETADGAITLTDEGGRLLYQDAKHISARGAERIRDVLEPMLSVPPPRR